MKAAVKFQRVVDAGLIHQAAHLLQGPRHRVDRAPRPSPLARRQEEDRFRIRRAEAAVVELVRDQRLEPALDARIAADLAVMHEEVAAMGEGMAVGPGGRGAGGGAHMGEEQAGAHLIAQGAQVLVGPGGPHLAVDARLGPLAVPADAEAVAVGLGLGLGRVKRLVDQRMRRARRRGPSRKIGSPR